MKKSTRKRYFHFAKGKKDKDMLYIYTNTNISSEIVLNKIPSPHLQENRNSGRVGFPQSQILFRK